MSKAFKCTILLYGILFYPCIGLFAFDDPDQLIYATEDFAPYNYLENGELKGFSVDLLKIIWQELRIKPQQINVYPWARAYKMLKDGNNVMLFTTAKTEDRANLFKWVCPISVNTRTVLISLAKNQSAIRSLDELKKCKIGIVRGDAAEQILLASGFSSDQMDSVSTLVQNIKNWIRAGSTLLLSTNTVFLKYRRQKVLIVITTRRST
ncbi:MAG: transporter substrate-binding domain-containing protein [Desulfobacteraceae bacterium]|nr:transporter substrate-binding domain-containing protein [Desulfobacteraceae bacterium]